MGYHEKKIYLKNIRIHFQVYSTMHSDKHITKRGRITVHVIRTSLPKIHQRYTFFFLIQTNIIHNNNENILRKIIILNSIEKI